MKEISLGANKRTIHYFGMAAKFMYTAKVLEEIEYSPNSWQGLKIGVFRGEGETEEQIGEYERNYPSLFRTFSAFQKEGKDYALYSPDYTATRIMALPECKDIGGEERNSYGFCPVDFYVPSYVEREMVRLNDDVHRYRVNEPSEKELLAWMGKYTPIDKSTGQRIIVEKPNNPLTPRLYYPFGFVAGCIWGDDSSWKIQFLDLSEADKGIVRREERFGYIALPDEMTLKQAINMRDYLRDPNADWAHEISISVQTRFNLETGKPVDADPFA